MKKVLFSLLTCSLVYAYSVNEKPAKEDLQTIGANANLVVVDFFASWCVSCKKELPLIEKLSKQLKNVQFIGVDVDEEKEEGLEFQKKLALSFHIYNDTEQKVIKNFDPEGVPAIYILKDGVVKKTHIGAVDDVDLVLKKDLAELK